MPIQEVEKIWMNGELVDWKDAKIHVLTHALHYGSAVFEGIRCYKTADGPAVFRLKEHIARLFESGKIYFMEIPFSEEELRKGTKDMLKANSLEECYIRPIAFRGYGEMGLSPLKSPIDVAIAAWPWGTYLGEDGLKNGIRTRISSYQKISPKALPPMAKATGQYLNSIIAKIECLQTGFDEAILLDHRGMVSEGPGENLFIIKDGTIITPSLNASILKGITRDSIMKIANDMGYKVVEEDITPESLLQADEAFFTGTAAELTPIREIDGHEIGKPGEMTKKLQDKFFDILKGKDENYKGWLDFV